LVLRQLILVLRRREGSRIFSQLALALLLLRHRLVLEVPHEPLHLLRELIDLPAPTVIVVVVSAVIRITAAALVVLLLLLLYHGEAGIPCICP